MTQGAQRQAKGRRGFALAIAGEHQHQALFQVALTHPLLLHLLASGHAAAIAVLISFWRQITAGTQLRRCLIKA